MPAKSTMDFGSFTLSKQLAAPMDLYAARTANTTHATVDMRGCRNGYMLVSLSIGTDVPASLVISDSEDNSTFAVLKTVAAATLTLMASTGLYKIELPNMKRYVKVSALTVTGTSADSVVSIVLVGKDSVHTPADGTTGSDADE